MEQIHGIVFIFGKKVLRYLAILPNAFPKLFPNFSVVIITLLVYCQDGEECFAMERNCSRPTIYCLKNVFKVHVTSKAHFGVSTEVVIEYFENSHSFHLNPSNIDHFTRSVPSSVSQSCHE